jgi:hypothetical protein
MKYYNYQRKISEPKIQKGGHNFWQMQNDYMSETECLREDQKQFINRFIATSFTSNDRITEEVLGEKQFNFFNYLLLKFILIKKYGENINHREEKSIEEIIGTLSSIKNIEPRKTDISNIVNKNIESFTKMTSNIYGEINNLLSAIYQKNNECTGRYCNNIPLELTMKKDNNVMDLYNILSSHYDMNCFAQFFYEAFGINEMNYQYTSS